MICPGWEGCTILIDLHYTRAMPQDTGTEQPPGWATSKLGSGKLKLKIGSKIHGWSHSSS